MAPTDPEPGAGTAAAPNPAAAAAAAAPVREPGTATATGFQLSALQLYFLGLGPEPPGEERIQVAPPGEERIGPPHGAENQAAPPPSARRPQPETNENAHWHPQYQQPSVNYYHDAVSPPPPPPGVLGTPMPMQSPAGGFWPHQQAPTPAPAAPTVVDIATAMLQQLPPEDRLGFAQHAFKIAVEIPAKERMAQQVAQTAQFAVQAMGTMPPLPPIPPMPMQSPVGGFWAHQQAPTPTAPAPPDIAAIAQVLPPEHQLSYAQEATQNATQYANQTAREIAMANAAAQSFQHAFQHGFHAVTQTFAQPFGNFARQ